MEEQEIREKAKELGIKSWHIKKIENLEAEIKELETPVEIKEEAPKIEEKKIEAKQDDSARMMELMREMNGMSFDSLMMKIKLLGKKSKFFKYKDIIEKQLNGN